MRDIIREYYEAVNDHNWEKLASTLAEDVVRIGIMSDFTDDIAKGKGPYVEFCKAAIGSFENHSMKIERIFYSADRRLACGETTETLKQPGSEPVVLHCLKTHELNEDGLITRIDQYRKGSPEGTPISISVNAVMAG